MPSQESPARLEVLLRARCWRPPGLKLMSILHAFLAGDLHFFRAGLTSRTAPAVIVSDELHPLGIGDQSAVTVLTVGSHGRGMLLLGCDWSFVPRRTQVALENTKKRIARRYLAGLQKVEDCGEGLRFRLCIDRFSQILIFRKFCVARLFDRAQFGLQDSQSFQSVHQSHPMHPPRGNTLLLNLRWRWV